MVPDYAIQNYFTISKNFPKFEVWFIVDDELNHQALLEMGVKAWLVPRIKVSDSTSRNTYRNGFWLNTTNRFLAMSDFHRSKSDSSLLQIESDVILSEKFPMESFLEIESKLAYPLSSPDVGLASTLWCRDSDATQFLADYAVECLSENNLMTDTDILGALANSHSDDVLVLRSGPDNVKAYKNVLGSRINSLSGSDHPINKLGVFDASSLGIHLCGSDPRNSFGVSRVFSPLPHHFMNLSALEFEIKEREIFLSIENESRQIFSLHNHSKNLRYFKTDYSEVLSSSLARRANGEFRKFSFHGFRLCIMDYLQLIKNKIRFLFRGVHR